MKRLWPVAALLLIAAPSVLAQSSNQSAQAGAQVPAEPRPVFRSGLDLVRLDVRVTGDDGRPVDDLRPDELTIEEEGAPRPVVLFQHIEATRGSYVDAAQRTIAAQVSTNQGSPHGHVYVLVFDESHILPGHEQRARRAAERFLRTHVRSGDRVALYALPGPGPQIEFTSDVFRVARELVSIRGAAEQTGAGALAALAPMRTYEAYEIVRGNQQILDRLTNEVSQSLLASDTRSTTSNRPSAAAIFDNPQDNRQVLFEDARSLVARADGEARRFLIAFADLIRTLRAVEGRKAVILFSEGFQVDHVTRELEDVAAAAAQSYSVIHAMDLNSRAVEASEDAPRGGEQSVETQDKLQSLGSLSAETGGTLVLDASSELDRALARLAESTEDYYLVGFAPASGNQADRNRYRRIRVKVTRPGLHVSTRTGYALSAAPTPTDRRRIIDAALKAPFAQQGLRIEYTTYALRGSAPSLQRVVVSLAAQLPAATDDAKAADVVYVVRNADTGKVTASGGDQIPLPQPPERGGGTIGMGFYRVQFELPAGAYLMRAVVREPGGLVGSADRRFEVGALSGPDITASDLVLDSADVTGLPVRATAYASDVLTGVFELYGRTNAQLEDLKVMTSLVPLDGGQTALSAPAELQPLKTRPDGVSRGARIELPLAGVAPGKYLVRASVRSGNDTVAEVMRDVTVNAGTRPAASGPVVVAARVEPLDVLRGEIARHLLMAIDARARSPLDIAAHAAARGNWPEVESALTASKVESADASVLRGAAAFARADYPGAVAAFRAAQDAGANDAALAFVLGWAHAGIGDDRAAITTWRNAIVMDSHLVPSYLALVDAYVRLGQPELALQVVQSGLRALPSSPELLDRLARLHGGL